MRRHFASVPRTATVLFKEPALPAKSFPKFRNHHCDNNSEIMPNYKLTYFNIRGLGEGPRLIFAQAGVKFEDHRLPMDSTEYKAISPFGQIPILEVDGQIIGQSAAIMRYLAHQHGLAGDTPLEDAQIDSIVDAGKDFGQSTKDWWGVKFGMQQGDAVSWADLLITDYMAAFHDQEPKAFDGYPKVAAWVEKVRRLPNIKKWLEERPKTPF